MLKSKFNNVTDAEKDLIQKLEDRREKLINHFPLWTALVATFGVVMIFYGFEKLIDRISLLANNPWILLVTGLIVLVATGTAYKKLN